MAVVVEYGAPIVDGTARLDGGTATGGGPPGWRPHSTAANPRRSTAFATGIAGLCASTAKVLDIVPGRSRKVCCETGLTLVHRAVPGR